MGKAEMWQDRVIDQFKDVRVIFMNPRRDDWDSSWTQSPSYGTQFNQQVKWELEMQDLADIHVYYFAKDTMSPITLLELGVYGGRNPKSTVVYVDPEYARRANVIMTCTHLGIACTGEYEQFTDILHKKIDEKHNNR